MKKLENVEFLSMSGALVSLLEKVGKGEEFSVGAYGFSTVEDKKQEQIPTLILGISTGKEKVLTITRSAGLLEQFGRLERSGELEKADIIVGHLQQQKFEKDGDSRTTWKFVANFNPDDLF